MAFGGYPPTRHFLSDLGIDAEITSESSATVRLRVTPEITGPDGGVRAGVLATLVDVVGGSAALRSLHPDWMATADLVLQKVRPARGPIVETRANVLRRGRTTLVVEAEVFDVAEEGSEVPVAWASMTFAVLPGRGPGTGRDVAVDLPDRWSFSGPGLDRPLVDALSISLDDAGAGVASVPVFEYLHNSIGAVQGGVMALLAEVAVESMLGTGPAPVVVTDLQVAYLALGRIGPIVSRTTALGPDADGVSQSAVVELIDQGADGRLTTVINVRAEPVVPAHPVVTAPSGVGR